MADTTLPASSSSLVRLLASVISAREVAVIKDLADVIDVKDPAKGPLGAPAPETVAEIEKLGLGKPLSVALGDAGADVGQKLSLAEKMVFSGADILKISVSFVSPEDAVAILKTLRDRIPSPVVKIVSAAYSDDEEALVTPFDLPDISKRSGIDGILIDTRYKNGRSVFDSMSVADLGAVMEKARGLRLMTALAGSINISHIKLAKDIRPDFLGVRSAITKNGDRGEEGLNLACAQLLKNEISEIQAGTGFV